MRSAGRKAWRLNLLGAGAASPITETRLFARRTELLFAAVADREQLGAAAVTVGLIIRVGAGQIGINRLLHCLVSTEVADFVTQMGVRACVTETRIAVQACG